MKVILGLNMEEMNYCVKFFNKVNDNIRYTIKMSERAYLYNDVDVEVIYVLKACEIMLKNLKEYNKEFEMEKLYQDHLIEWLGVQSKEDTKTLFKDYTIFMISEIDKIDDAVYHLYSDMIDFWE